MKKIKILPTLFIVLTLVLGISLTSCNNVNNPQDEKSPEKTGQDVMDSEIPDENGQETMEKAYKDYVKDFEECKFDDIDFSSEEDFVVYIGFEDCPYCQKFVPCLNEFATKENLKVFYVDSSDDDKSLLSYSDEHGLETVPALILHRDGEESSMSLMEPKSDVYSIEEVEEALSSIGYN